MQNEQLSTLSDVIEQEVSHLRNQETSMCSVLLVCECLTQNDLLAQHFTTLQSKFLLN